MKRLVFFIIVYILFVNLSFAQTERSLTKNPPKLSEYVTDETGTLVPDEISSLKLKLRKFYDSTSTQVVVLLLTSLDGEPVENVANAIFHHNGIGGKGKDNGVLLLISKGDRKIRIEVGYGLEGVLTDAMSKQIISREIAPELKTGNYFKGIDNAVNSIIALSKGEYSKDKADTVSSGPSFLEVLAYMIPLTIFIVVITIIVKATKRKVSGYGSSGSSGYYSNSSSGSGWSSSDSSSSSDSGFSGDGGDSGGGGASGDY